MNKIWLDITTIYAWHRPAVGIIKTEAECALYALQTNQGHINFCRFDVADGYTQVASSDVYGALERVLGRRAYDQISKVQAAVVTQERSALSTEEEVTPPAPNVGFSNSTQVGTKSVSSEEVASKKFKTQGLQLVPRKRVAPFDAGDVYISLGLDWDQKDLCYLYEQKRAIGFKVLLFCYDLIPVKLPHLCVAEVTAIFSRYFVNLAWCADEVLCISECTRKDLQTFLGGLGTPMPSMEVVKLGTEVGAITQEISAQDVTVVLNQRYILFVSTIERRKNHETIYHAYTRLITQGIVDLPLLVFVGMHGWGVNDFMTDLRLDPLIQNRIKVLNNVSASDLVKLYQQSYFTVFPSLYEGWGLPVGESLAFGKFCLASNAASIPEVGGDLVEYLDPRDVPTWATRMAWYISHPEEVRAREQRIAREYKVTSWSETAQYVFNRALLLKETVKPLLGKKTPWISLASSLSPGTYHLDVPLRLPNGDYFLEVIAESDSEAEQTRQASTTRDTELDQTRQALAESRTQLAQVYRSWSWRITSPIRAAVRPFIIPLHALKNLGKTDK